MSWLKKHRGEDAVEQKLQQIEEEIANRLYRVWMKPEAESIFVFLDDDPPLIDEHQFYINNSWQNWATCLGVLGEPCPACASDRAYAVGFYTVLEIVQFSLKDGTVVTNPRRVLPAKFTLMKQLKQERKLRDGSLVGCMYRVNRTSSDAPNTGDEWEFIKRLTPEEIKGLNEDAEPVNFEEYLAPLKADVLEALVRKAKDKDSAGSAPAAGPRSGETVYNEDDIDF